MTFCLIGGGSARLVFRALSARLNQMRISDPDIICHWRL